MMEAPGESGLELSTVSYQPFGSSLFPSLSSRERRGSEPLTWLDPATIHPSSTVKGEKVKEQSRGANKAVPSLETVDY